MLITWLITAATLVVALVVIAIVAVGSGSGAAADRAPDELTEVMAKASRHLNGDAEPPKQLVELFGAIPELRPSARSAQSANSYAPQSAKEASR